MSHRTFEKDRPGKLFVGGLAEDIDEKTLEREFSKFGRITEAMVIRDKVRQVSRGFGFVTYENPMDAEEAVKHMDGKEIHGKKLHVEDAVRGGILNSHDSGRFSRDGGFRDDGFRGRPRGGPPRGGRGGGRGGFPPRDGPPRGGGGGYGGRGEGFSRGRGRGGMMSRFEGRSSPPPMRRDDSPPRSGLMSRPLSSRGRNGFDSGRGRPLSSFESRRDDRYDSGFSERGPPPRSRDPYGSPPRDTGRGGGLLDSRLGPSRGSRDYPPSSRDYPPSRDYPSQRDYSPDRGADRYSYRDSYGQSRSEDRGDGYSRGAAGRGDYMTSRSDMRDSPRDSYPPRGGDGYSSMSSRDYREPLSSRGGDRFESGSSSMRFSRDLDSRGPPRSDSYMSRDSGPPSRSYGGSSSMSGSRGPPPFSSSRGPYPTGGSDRRSSGDRDSFSAGTRRPSGPPPSRGGPPPSKRPRSDGPSSRPPPPSFRR
ncbi:uncharacterized protein LOC143288971 isoform X3 [Babylonia areolata]|uniref:uncharacterized protein LOC143288971 isoform X3 n=1 Tax=Babylonia areolata TaxID=304850 RepID=UPI003FCF630A